MQSPTWIRAREIDQWADSPQGKVLLPELIGRLVRATVPVGDLSKCDFASEAETHRPGYDGTTVTDKGTLYVPAGIAFWELGCDTNPQKKAEDDYLKRISEHEERVKAGETDDISKAVYVAVTGRDWHDKKAPRIKKTVKGSKGKNTTQPTIPRGMAEWAKIKTKEKRFRTVEAYDSNRIEQWLREAPAVALWLARQMGKTISGIHDIKSYWLDIQATLQKPLPPEVLLVSRDDTAAAFKRWVEGSPCELPVRAPSAMEVAAVFTAWVHTLPDTEANAISSRTIVVEDRETWISLCESLNSLILIAAPRLEPDPELFSKAIRKEHFVLRHANLRTPSRGTAVDLGRMRRFDLEQSLKKAGLEEAEARRIANAAGGNFTILRRIYSKSPPDGMTPRWEKDSTLAALLLAVSWEDNRTADREIVEKLTKRDYADVREVAAQWRTETDAPLRLTVKDRGDGKVWEFLSTLDAWESLHFQLNSDVITLFKNLAVEVLSEDNPGLSLPPDERPMAAVKGLVPHFSHYLRHGIAEILAIGATREDESGILRDFDFKGCAAAVVKRVLDSNCKWQRWASLGQLLSSLAEAAPDEFLTAVENDVYSSNSQIVELIRQEIPPSGFGGAAYHSGLLWALETAAWPSIHFRRVASILAQLSERDPGGNWSNRPQASTVSLFFSWRPQTVAPIGERIETLRMICSRWPAAAWGILTRLMPENHEAISDSSKPVYRDWAAGWSGNVTYEDYFTFIDTLVELAVQLAHDAPVRWGDLLDEISNLHRISRTAYAKVKGAFEALSTDGMSSDLRVMLWQKLRVTVQQHTRFHDANWAMPMEELKNWEMARDRLAPDDPVIYLAHLFSHGAWESSDDSLSYEQQQEKLVLDRRAAIRKIWLSGGIEAVKRLALRSNEPWAIGWPLALELGDEAFVDVIPFLLKDDNEALVQFAATFAMQLINTRDVEWAESVPTGAWSTAQVAVWSLQMPFGTRTWDWVAQRGEEVESYYWQRVGSWVPPGLSMEEVTRAFHKFLSASRAWIGLKFLLSREDIKKPANAGLFITALEAVLSDSNSENGDMAAHHLHKALSFLQKPETGADLTRVAQLEFSFLPVLDEHFILPHTLQRELSRDPAFFVDCLKIVYRPRDSESLPEGDGAETKEQTPEQKKHQAQRIWKLLHSWKFIPGTNDQGVMAPDVFHSWVTEARKLGNAAHRREVCDSYLGGLFAKSPADTDDGIPLVVIRNVIEECKSEEMERGFMTGLRNLRGVWSKSHDEGGKQERDLAANFEKHAHICAPWPRTAQALRTVAKEYLREAELEDERASSRE